MTITKSPTPSPSPTGTSGAQDQALQQLMGSLSSGASASTAGKVYMGMTHYGMPEGADARTRKNISDLSKRESIANWMSTDDADAQYFTWSQKFREDFRAKGLISGLLKKGDGDMEAASLWHNLVLQAANYGAQDRKISPLDILTGYVKSNGGGSDWVKQGDFEVNSITGEKRYIGPQFKTTTQSNIDLTDPATARAVATKVFQDLLGRDPNQGEIGSYAQALGQSEAQNPQQATTTTQYDMTTGDPTGSSTITSGGTTADGQAQLAEDKIKKTKEYGVTQAATTYMNALQSAVGGGA